MNFDHSNSFRRLITIMLRLVSMLTTVGFLFSLLTTKTAGAGKLKYRPDNIGELLSTPRLAFHPKPEGPSNLIRFVPSKPETYMKYVNDTKKIITEYLSYRWDHRSWIDCEDFDKYRPEYYEDAACHFDVKKLGKCLTPAFGFDDVQPCILFNLERVYDWIPLEYHTDTVPDNIRDLWSQYSVTLKCGTTDSPSHDNIGPIEYYPREGFPFKYFPYNGQPGWRPPLVFVQFVSPSPAQTLFVECKIYARNIIHNRTLDTGMVSFELLVD